MPHAPDTAPDIARNLAAVLAEIAAAARRAGRDPGEVALVAVSKAQSPAAISSALSAGQCLFGENRVQEAAAKFPALRRQHPEIELHLIGPLQTNKAAEAVALFDVLQSLDRPKLARVLAQEIEKQGRRPRLYVQVNTGEEPQKAGVAPGETAAFVKLCRDELGLGIEGLMCIPPLEEPAAPHFALLRKLAGELGLPGLSMGMSADFTAAVELGATVVRVGSAIFGQREKP